MDTSTPRLLGSSQLAVSPLGFGGGTIGSAAVPAEAALQTVKAAWEANVRLFDTAPWYGIGRSERRLGVAFDDIAPPRESFAVNTKVGKSLVPEAARDESKKTYCADGSVRTPRDARTGFRIAFDYSYDAIMAQHQESLQRLGLARVNTLTIHDIDYGYHDDAQIEIALSQLSKDGGGGATALEELRTSGVIDAIGCGCNLESRNAFSWKDSKHEDLIERLVELVDLDFFIVAGAYTLLEQRALRRVLPLCRERRIGCIGATPFAGGWLANPEQAAYMYGAAAERIRTSTKAMQVVCDKYDVPLAAAAIQFQLSHPSFAAVIPGGMSPREVQETKQFVTHAIPTELWVELKDAGLIAEDAPTLH